MDNTAALYQAILEEGTRKFSPSRPRERSLDGKLNGADDFLAYAKYIDRDFVDPFHIQHIAETLTAVERGDKPFTMIFLPPRFGKSHITSKIFHSWYRGRHPKDEILLASYNKSKAAEFTGWVRDTCEGPYFHDIFPDVMVRPDKRAADEWHTVQGGITMGAGTRGGFTGRGAHLGIIDDPIKDYEEAKSAVIQDKIWDWYRWVFRTRLYPTSKVILIMTRWVTDDLAGRLLERDGDAAEGGKWHVLKLPILNAHGESLWPEMYPVEEIEDIRNSIGENVFQALYMQEPADAVERMFSDPKFSEPPRTLRPLAYLDPAFGGSDFSAFTAGGIHKSDDESSDEELIYITRGNIWRSTIDVTYNRVEKYCRELNISVLFVESNAAQKAVAAEFRRRGITVKEINSTVNKFVRIQNNVKLNWHRLRFSRHVDQDYLQQVLLYSELARHDDAPDSLSGLIAALGPGKGSLEKRYGGFSRLLRGW